MTKLGFQSAQQLPVVPLRGQPAQAEAGAIENRVEADFRGSCAWVARVAAGYVHPRVGPAGERFGKLAPHAGVINRLQHRG